MIHELHLRDLLIGLFQCTFLKSCHFLHPGVEPPLHRVLHDAGMLHTGTGLVVRPSTNLDLLKLAHISWDLLTLIALLMKNPNFCCGQSGQGQVTQDVILRTRLGGRQSFRYQKICSQSVHTPAAPFGSYWPDKEKRVSELSSGLPPDETIGVQRAYEQT